MLRCLRKRRTAVVLGAIVAGAGLRLAISLRAPVSYDEVFVMGVGLDEMLGSARAWFLDVPLRRSNAITPLWCWVQSVPALVTGRVSLWGLRVVPLALGGLTLLVTWRVARARIGRGPAALLVVLAALSDVLAFTNARGEFAESLLLLGVLPYACLIGDRKHTLTKGLLGALLLLTHLGKGLFLVAALTAADAVAHAVRNRTRPDLWRLALSLAIAALPTAVWLAVAGTVAAGRPLVTDIGPMSGPVEALWSLTAAYRTTKQHMVGTYWDAAQIWLDGGVWSLTVLTTFPVLVGLIAALRRFHGRRGALALGSVVWMGVGVLVVVGRGLLGSRFHLLYLPGCWLAAALGLWRLRRLTPEAWLMLATAWGVSIAALGSWTSWTDRAWHPSPYPMLFGIVVFMCPLMAYIGRRFSERAAWSEAVSLGLATLIAIASWGGPLRWARFARMEAFAGREELTALDAYRSGKAALPRTLDRTLYIDLTNFFLQKDGRTASDLRRAEYYARLEVQRMPRDARAWFYLGEVLRQRGAPVEQVRAAWQCSYDLKPAPLVKQRLTELDGAAPAATPASTNVEDPP
jgi:hypothetical protein